MVAIVPEFGHFLDNIVTRVIGLVGYEFAKSDPVTTKAIIRMLIGGEVDLNENITDAYERHIASGIGEGQRRDLAMLDVARQVVSDWRQALNKIEDIIGDQQLVADEPHDNAVIMFDHYGNEPYPRRMVAHRTGDTWEVVGTAQSYGWREMKRRYPTIMKSEWSVLA